MIDIVQYRCQIGLFGQKIFRKKFLFKQDHYEKASWNRSQSGNNTLLTIKFILKFIVLSVLLTPAAWSTPSSSHLTSCCTPLCSGAATDPWLLASSQVTAGTGHGWVVGGVGMGTQVEFPIRMETGNFGQSIFMGI